MEEETDEMKKTGLFKKISYIFDRKQKLQLVGLGVMIFIGGLLETLGVGAMIPVVNVLLAPEGIMDFISEYEILRSLCGFLRIETVRRLTMTLLFGMMAIYIIKNLIQK